MSVLGTVGSGSLAFLPVVIFARFTVADGFVSLGMTLYLGGRSAWRTSAPTPQAVQRVLAESVAPFRGEDSAARFPGESLELLTGVLASSFSGDVALGDGATTVRTDDVGLAAGAGQTSNDPQRPAPGRVVSP